MPEKESGILRETTLFQNPNQTVIRQTADVLDYLRHSTRFGEADLAARSFLAEKTSPFVTSVREGFTQINGDMTRDQLLRAFDEAEQIPYSPPHPENWEFAYRPGSLEAVRFALVIFSFMPEKIRPPQEPDGFLIATRKMQEHVDQIAEGADPREMIEEADPSLALTMSFFRVGRRLPIKQIEGKHEKDQRIDEAFRDYVKGIQ